MIQISEEFPGDETLVQKELLDDSKFKRLPNVSHFDGKSPVSFRCSICRLPGHDMIKNSENLCIPCSRFQIIQKISNVFGRYSLYALVLGAAIFFLDALSNLSFLLPVLGLVFLTPMMVSTSYVQMQIYRGIPEVEKISHMLKYFTLLKYNEGIYYDAAERLLKQELIQGQDFRQILLYYLVEYVILDTKPISVGVLQRWSEDLGMTVHNLLEEMMEVTNLIDAFDFHKGVGVLPEFWPVIVENTSLRDEVLDRINITIETIEDATSSEKQYFMEDLYLIEEQLRDIISSNPKWKAIEVALDEFEPETPPTNMFQAFQAQAEENAKQIEQRNQKKKST